MKKNLFVCAVAITLMVMVSACGSNKQTAQNNSKNPFGDTFEAPCQELDTETEFGATGIYKCSAAQKGQAQMYALQNAQQIVRMKIHHAYKGMVSDFNQSYGGNAGNDIQNKISMAGDQVIDAVINDTRATCVKFSAVDDRGDIECYVGIRISKQELAKKITERVGNVLTEEEKMRIDYNEKKFRDRMEARFGTVVQ